MKQPLVTVLMSVYNGAAFLHQAVESILEQTMRDFEFLVVDDGSTDDTARILASYRDRRLRVVSQPNQGLAASLNRGLHIAQTDLVARMDADDVALPDRLQVQLEEHERLGRPDVLGGAVVLISESGRPLRTVSFPSRHGEIVRNLTHGPRSPIAHPTVLLKRQAVLRHGSYDPFFHNSSEDYDLWLRMSEGSRFANTPRVLLLLRLRRGSMESRRLYCDVDGRDSPTWYACLALQRHFLERDGLGSVWADPNARQELMDLLWPRVVQSGRLEAAEVSRTLSLIRAELLSPGHRRAAIRLALHLCRMRWRHAARYVAKRRLPPVAYLSAADVVSGCSVNVES